MYLLQRARDEAHDFAIRFHRSKRSKGMIVSELDDVPGPGPTRRTALIKHFGSVKLLQGGRTRRDRRGSGHRAPYR